MTGREKVLALAAYIFLCFAWGSTYIGIRVVVETMSPFWFAGSRFLISGALLLALAWALRRPMPTKFGPIVVMAFFYVTISNTALCWGLKYVSGGIGANMGALTPLVVALMMAMLPRGERLGLIGWAGLAMGAAGVTLLVWQKVTGGEWGLLLACASWSAGTIYARYNSQQYDPLSMTAFEMLIGGAIMMAAAPFIEPAMHGTPTADTWLAYGYMVVVGGCLGFIAYTYLIQKVPATKASTFGYINPGVGMALGALVLGETYTGMQLAGSGVLLLAVFLVQSSKAR